MFRKILYPTDFSKVADRALAYVKKLKEAGTEELIILYVIENYDLELMVTACEWKEGKGKECVKKVEEDLRKKAMKQMQELAEKTGLKVKTLIREGKPFHQIVKVAEEENVSLIVMGSHGRGEFAQLLVGSVTENVIPKRPVLVVR